MKNILRKNDDLLLLISRKTKTFFARFFFICRGKNSRALEFREMNIVLLLLCSVIPHKFTSSRAAADKVSLFSTKFNVPRIVSVCSLWRTLRFGRTSENEFTNSPPRTVVRRKASLLFFLTRQLFVHIELFFVFLNFWDEIKVYYILSNIHTPLKVNEWMRVKERGKNPLNLCLQLN